MVLRKSTQASLDACRRDHTAVEVAIADLHGQRRAAISDDADADVIVALDKQIIDQSARLTALASKIEILQIKLEREQSDRQRKEYAGKVSRLESEIATLERRRRKLRQHFDHSPPRSRN